jgi:hypothetical protein
MWCHGTVAELLGEAGLCRCARMPDAAYVQVTDCYWREMDIRQTTRVPWADVSDLNRGNATLRPAKRTLAQLVGGLDSRGDSLKTAGTNRPGPGRDGLRRRAPAPGDAREAVGGCRSWVELIAEGVAGCGIVRCDDRIGAALNSSNTSSSCLPSVT